MIALVLGLGLVALFGIVVVIIGTAASNFAAQVVGLVLLTAGALGLLGIEAVLYLLTEANL